MGEGQNGKLYTVALPGGASGARAPPFSKKKKIELVFSKKYKIIGNILVSYTQHKNKYLHQNICLGFLNKSKYFVKS